MGSIYEDFKAKYPQCFDDGRLIGFGCGDGWRPLLELAFDKLSLFGVKVVQVKEKFGGLRIYLDKDHGEKAEAIVMKAEEESLKTCEECGTKEGVTTEGAWRKTLCPKCRENRYQEGK